MQHGSGGGRPLSKWLSRISTGGTRFLIETRLQTSDRKCDFARDGERCCCSRRRPLLKTQRGNAATLSLKIQRGAAASEAVRNVMNVLFFR